MSNSTVTITPNTYPNGYDNTQRSQIVNGHFAISAGNYFTGGMALNWSIEGIKSDPQNSTAGPAPRFAPIVYEDSNSANYSGLVYWVDATNGNLHIGYGSNNNNAVNPFVEVGNNTATPTAAVNASIAFQASFFRG
jgi:hypothetical protein